MNDYFTFFYVKHFELPLCMKCAIQIKLPCLAYVANNLINNNNNNISALGVLKGYLTKKCHFCHDLPSSYKPVCLYCISIVSRFG